MTRPFPFTAVSSPSSTTPSKCVDSRPRDPGAQRGSPRKGLTEPPRRPLLREHRWCMSDRLSPETCTGGPALGDNCVGHESRPSPFQRAPSQERVTLSLLVFGHEDLTVAEQGALGWRSDSLSPGVLGLSPGVMGLSPGVLGCPCLLGPQFSCEGEDALNLLSLPSGPLVMTGQLIVGSLSSWSPSDLWGGATPGRE